MRRRILDAEAFSGRVVDMAAENGGWALAYPLRSSSLSHRIDRYDSANRVRGGWEPAAKSPTSIVLMSHAILPDGSGKVVNVNVIVADPSYPAPNGYSLVASEAASPGWKWSETGGFVAPLARLWPSL